MANIIKYLKRIKPVCHRSSNRMKVFVIVVIILGIVGLFLIRGAMVDLKNANRDLANQATQLEMENEELKDKILDAYLADEELCYIIIYRGDKVGSQKAKTEGCHLS